MSILCCSEQGRCTRFDGTLVDVSPKLTEDFHNTQVSTYRACSAHLGFTRSLQYPSNDPVHHSPSFTNTLQTLEKCQQNVTSLHLGQLHKGQCARHALHLTQLFYFLLKLGPRHPFWPQRIVFLEAPGELWEKSIRKGICMHSLLSAVSMKLILLYSPQYVTCLKMICFSLPGAWTLTLLEKNGGFQNYNDHPTLSAPALQRSLALIV